TLQIIAEIIARLSVHPHGSVRPRSTQRLVHPNHVDVVRQGSQSHLRRLLRQFRYPLLFRGHGVRLRCSGHVSLQRFQNPASPSLPRVPVRRVPLARRYYETLRRPAAPPTSLRCPSLGGTSPCACVRTSRSSDADDGPGAFGSGSPAPA